MIRFIGYLYGTDGSHRQEVELSFSPERQLILKHANEESLILGQYALDTIKISSRLGNTPRWLELPDGNRIETRDNQAVDQILNSSGKDSKLRLHKLESRWTYIAVFLLVVVAGTAGFSLYGLPKMAKELAFSLPSELTLELGQHTLEAMDQVVFDPSKLPVERRQQLQQLFTGMLNQLHEHADSDEPKPYRLLFRDSPLLGANALALPSGIVVLTDDIVALAGNEELELLAVLAHEIGHLEHRHALRTAIQSSVLPLIIISVTGDVSSASTLVAGLPTLLLESGYSQQFELEADHFASEFLKVRGINSDPLISLLDKLEKQHPHGTPSFLSSHPPTEKRISALRQ